MKLIIVETSRLTNFFNYNLFLLNKEKRIKQKKDNNYKNQ